MIELRAVEFGYRDRPVLRGVELAARPGELVVVVGPNGAGKSTLARVAAGLLRPTRGEALVDGRATSSWPRRELALRVAYLPQDYPLAFGYSAQQVVLMGRFAHRRAAFLDSAEDLAAARAAMARTDTESLSGRRFDELSGGERRRVLLAQALCQGAPALVLDEPTAALDPAHAQALFSALRALADGGGALLVVTHDVGAAARIATRMIALRDGGIVADGPPAELLAGDALERAFDVPFHVGRVPETGAVFAVPR